LFFQEKKKLFPCISTSVCLLTVPCSHVHVLIFTSVTSIGQCQFLHWNICHVSCNCRLSWKNLWVA